MNVTVFPHPLRGRVAAPPSKSHVHRLLIAAALCREETILHCPGENEDIAATIRCLRQLGADIHRGGEEIRLSGPLSFGGGAAALDCGESGSTLRFLLPLCAIGDPSRRVALTGHGRLPQRPNGPLLQALRAHGAKIDGDFLPLTAAGRLKPGHFSLPGGLSSQYFSGLLFALPLLKEESTLTYTSPLESRPYVDLTLSVLHQFGIRTERMENGWRVPGGQQYTSPGAVDAEGDWSAAAFWYAADRLGSAVTVDGLDPRSCQGDKAVGALLEKIGGEIDVTDTPDLMPVLSAAAAAAIGTVTRITGAARLRLKESDRISAMAELIRALGGQARETQDGLIIRGGALRGGTVDAKGDHRIAMSAAIAAAACAEPVTIAGAEAVNKSYPGFFRDFEALGGIIHVG